MSYDAYKTTEPDPCPEGREPETDLLEPPDYLCEAWAALDRVDYVAGLIDQANRAYYAGDPHAAATFIHQAKVLTGRAA